MKSRVDRIKFFISDNDLIFFLFTLFSIAMNRLKTIGKKRNSKVKGLDIILFINKLSTAESSFFYCFI